MSLFQCCIVKANRSMLSWMVCPPCFSGAAGLPQWAVGDGEVTADCEGEPGKGTACPCELSREEWKCHSWRTQNPGGTGVGQCEMDSPALAFTEQVIVEKHPFLRMKIKSSVKWLIIIVFMSTSSLSLKFRYPSKSLFPNTAVLERSIRKKCPFWWNSHGSALVFSV